MEQPFTHETVIHRFIAACQADERIVAASLGGSYARGATDAYSDLDFGLITTDEAFEEFVAGREAFVRQLGEPLFLEDFDLPDIVYCIFDDGVETEIVLGRVSHFAHLHNGLYRALVDKKDILAGVIFPKTEVTKDAQVEILRRQVYWFWHDLSHFITAIGRGQLWWAGGQLEALRRYCVTLPRLRHDFSAQIDLDEPYYKIERVMPPEQIAQLQATFCPLERDAMLAASQMIVKFYRELASELTQTHNIVYPTGLEQLLLDRLEKLGS